MEENYLWFKIHFLQEKDNWINPNWQTKKVGIWDKKVYLEFNTCRKIELAACLQVAT